MGGMIFRMWVLLQLLVHYGIAVALGLLAWQLFGPKAPEAYV